MRTVSARSSPSGSGRSGGDMRRTLGWRRGDQARELRRRGGAGAGDRARGGAPGALRRSRGFRTGAPGGRLRAAGGRLPRRLGGRGAGRLRRLLPLRRDDGRAPADVRRSRGARARPLARAARGAGGRGAESRLRLRPAGDGRPSAGGDRTLRLLGLPADPALRAVRERRAQRLPGEAARHLVVPLRGEAESERDQDRARDRVEGAAHARAAQDGSGPRDSGGVRDQPDERHRAEEQPERQHGRERGAAVRRELREEAGEEDRHLRIPEVAEHALAERGRGRESPTRRAGGGQAARASATAGGDERLGAQVDEVSRPRELERHEGRLGGDEERGDARARGERPNRLARRDDHERRDAEKGKEVTAHAYECGVPAPRRQPAPRTALVFHAHKAAPPSAVRTESTTLAPWAPRSSDRTSSSSNRAGTTTLARSRGSRTRSPSPARTCGATHPAHAGDGTVIWVRKRSSSSSKAPSPSTSASLRSGARSRAAGCWSSSAGRSSSFGTPARRSSCSSFTALRPRPARPSSSTTCRRRAVPVDPAARDGSDFVPVKHKPAGRTPPGSLRAGRGPSYAT